MRTNVLIYNFYHNWQLTLITYLRVKINFLIYEPGHAKMCLMSYANNKGANQPAHPRSLISAFVVRYLDSISRFYSRNFKTLASFCGCAGRFVSGLVENSRRHYLSCRGSYIYIFFYSDS